MKKLFLALLLSICFSSVVQAQTNITWYPVDKTNWGIVAWDPVTQLIDGDPLPAPTIAALGYNVYAKNVITSVVIPIASNITATQQQIALPSRGSYIVGVEAQLLYAGDSVASGQSEISWSEVPAVCKDAKTFGFKFQTGPKPVGGMRPEVGS